MSSAGAQLRRADSPLARSLRPSARPNTWFISSWMASRSWNGSQRERFVTSDAPPCTACADLGPGPGPGSGSLLLLPLFALVDDLGVDQVALGLLRAGLARLGLGGAGRAALRLPGLRVDRLGQL